MQVINYVYSLNFLDVQEVDSRQGEVSTKDNKA